MGSLVAFVALIICGGFVFVRMRGNSKEKKASVNLVKQLRDGDVNPEEVAKGLKIKYKILNLTEGFELIRLMNNLKENRTVDKCQIQHIQQINGNKYLLVTNCHDEDYDVKLNGKYGDSERVYNVNFVLEIEENQLHICSDYQEVGIHKSFRFAFGRNLAMRVT